MLLPLTAAADDKEPVELIGTARDYHAYRDWQSYYWRDDFQFTLDEESYYAGCIA